MKPEHRMPNAFASNECAPARSRFTHLAAARQHAIALGRAHAAQDSYECPNLIADIPMLRAAFESAVLDMRRSRLGQADAEATEKTPLCSRNLGGRQEQRAPGPAQAQV